MPPILTAEDAWSNFAEDAFIDDGVAFGIRLKPAATTVSQCAYFQSLTRFGLPLGSAGAAPRRPV
jgi:hypothetical protein